MELLTVKETARFLRISESTLYRYCTRGLLPHIKTGRFLRFEKTEIEKWLEQGGRKAALLTKFILPHILQSGGVNVATTKKGRRHCAFGSVYQRKPGGSWTINYRNSEGKRIQKVVRNATSKEQALIALQNEVEEDFLKSQGIERERKPVSFKEYADIYIETYAKPKKRSWRSDAKYLASQLIPFFGEMELSEIRHEDVGRFIAKRLKDGVKKNTINRHLQVLRRMMNLSKEDYGCPAANPVKSCDLFNEAEFRRTRVLRVGEEERLLRESSPHLKLIIRFALETGCRLQEILKLRVEDLDFEHDLIVIRPEVNKSGRQDIIPMSSNLKRLLEEIVAKSPSWRGFVFLYEGKPMKSVKTAFSSACKRAKIKGLQFRDLRRTYSSRLHEKGIDALVISRLLRHSSFKISEQVYIQSNLRMMKEAVEKLAEKQSESQKSGDNLVTKRKSRKRETFVTIPFSMN